MNQLSERVFISRRSQKWREYRDRETLYHRRGPIRHLVDVCLYKVIQNNVNDFHHIRISSTNCARLLSHMMFPISTNQYLVLTLFFEWVLTSIQSEGIKKMAQFVVHDVASLLNKKNTPLNLTSSSPLSPLPLPLPASTSTVYFKYNEITS